MNWVLLKPGTPGRSHFPAPPFLSFRSDKKAEKIRLARPAPLRPPLPAHKAPPAPLLIFFLTYEPYTKNMFSRVFEVADYDFACFGALPALLKAHLINSVSSS